MWTAPAGGAGRAAGAAGTEAPAGRPHQRSQGARGVSGADPAEARGGRRPCAQNNSVATADVDIRGVGTLTSFVSNIPHL